MATHILDLALLKQSSPSSLASLCSKRLLCPGNAPGPHIWQSFLTPLHLRHTPCLSHERILSAPPPRESDFSLPVHVTSLFPWGCPRACPVLILPGLSCTQQPAGQTPCSAQTLCNSISFRLKFKVLIIKAHEALLDLPGLPLTSTSTAIPLALVSSVASPA